MKKLVYAINTSIDGFCDHTLSIPDDELLDYFTRLTLEADTLLYGRKTYELMVPYWPDAAKDDAGQTQGEIDFAHAFVSVPRIVVFSKTLNSQPFNSQRLDSTTLKYKQENTTVIRDNPEEEIQKLKEGEGKNILVGGVSFPAQLLQLGLIDEMHFVVHPVIAGSGRPLFDGGGFKEHVPLTLIRSQVFKSGCVAHHYRKP